MYLFKKYLIFKSKLLKSGLSKVISTSSISLSSGTDVACIYKYFKNRWGHAICNSFWHDSWTFCQKTFEQILNLSPHYLWKIYKLTHFCKVSVMSYMLWRVPLNQYASQHQKIWLYKNWNDEEKIMCTIIINSSITQVYLNQKYLAW